jgi:hypothetical protein
MGWNDGQDVRDPHPEVTTKDGRWDDPLSEVFSVVPTTVYSYAKGDPFGQTTHRF